MYNDISKEIIYIWKKRQFNESLKNTVFKSGADLNVTMRTLYEREIKIAMTYIAKVHFRISTTDCFEIDKLPPFVGAVLRKSSYKGLATNKRVLQTFIRNRYHVEQIYPADDAC